MGDAGSGEAEQPYFWLLTEQRAAAYTFKVQRELKAEQQGVAGAQAKPAAVQEVQAEVERVQIDAIKLSGHDRAAIGTPPAPPNPSPCRRQLSPAASPRLLCCSAPASCSCGHPSSDVMQCS